MPIRIFCFLALVFIAQPGNAQQTSDTPDGSRQLELNLEAFPDNAKKEELQLDLQQFDDQPANTVEPVLQNGQSKQLELNLDQFEQTDGQIDNQKSQENLELDLDQFDKSNKEKDPELNLEQFDNADGKMNAEATDTATKEANGSVYNTRYIIIIGSLVALVILYLLFKRRRRR